MAVELYSTPNGPLKTEREILGLSDSGLLNIIDNDPNGDNTMRIINVVGGDYKGDSFARQFRNTFRDFLNRQNIFSISIHYYNSSGVPKKADGQPMVEEILLDRNANFGYSHQGKSNADSVKAPQTGRLNRHKENKRNHF